MVGREGEGLTNAPDDHDCSRDGQGDVAEPEGPVCYFSFFNLEPKDARHHVRRRLQQNKTVGQGLLIAESLCMQSLPLTGAFSHLKT